MGIRRTNSKLNLTSPVQMSYVANLCIVVMHSPLPQSSNSSNLPIGPPIQSSNSTYMEICFSLNSDYLKFWSKQYIKIKHTFEKVWRNPPPPKNKGISHVPSRFFYSSLPFPLMTDGEHFLQEVCVLFSFFEVLSDYLNVPNNNLALFYGGKFNSGKVRFVGQPLSPS